MLGLSDKGGHFLFNCNKMYNRQYSDKMLIFTHNQSTVCFKIDKSLSNLLFFLFRI